MAHAIESRASSPANDLRDALDKAERQVVTLDGANIEEFLLLLDQIERMFEGLAQTESDMRPEESRWESLLNRLSSAPGPLVKAANQAGGLERLRQRHLPAESFWWHLDAEVTRRRIQMVRRTLVTLVVIAAVVGGGLWAVDFFFPPDPRAVMLVNTNANIDQLIMEQKWDAALQVVESAQQQLPNEPELLVWEGVLSEQLGDASRAERALNEARQLLPGRLVEFWILVGNHRLMVGNLEGADQAGHEALALDPENAEATFLLGGVAEARGDTLAAVDYFNRVFDLAEQDNPQLAVIARVRMGNLLQQVGPFPATESITATLTVTTTETVTP
jgi:cytochrome c-type biogenesis protein CcmH/NrfG